MKHFERLKNEMFPTKKKTTPIPQIIVDSVRDDDILATLEKEDRVSRYAACDANHECHLRVAVFPRIKHWVMCAICTDTNLDRYAEFSHWLCDSAVNEIVENLFKKWLTTVRK